MKRVLSICDKIIENSFYLLFFLVPLILTPFNFELFEYNKMMLVYFLTVIIVAAWLIKMVASKKPIFHRTFLDLPLLIFLISQFLSYFFSIDRHTSFWGYYSRFHGGLASTISYILLYYAFVSNMNKRKTLSSIFYALCSAALVAAYGIAEHFGIDKEYWVQDVQNRVFSTFGQPNWLAAYLVALMPIPMAMVLSPPSGIAKLISHQKERRLRTSAFAENLVSRKLEIKSATPIFYFLFSIFYLCLLYTKSRSGLLGFGVAYALFWALIFAPSLIQRKKTYQLSAISYQLKRFFLITILLSLITLFVGTPWTPNVSQIYTKLTSHQQPVVSSQQPVAIPAGGTESGEIRKIVWKGAIEIFKHYPIFGSGVETFAYSYYNFRPREHNDVSEWDFLYNKAHNEYLNYLATTGLVGLGSYLLLIGWFLARSIKYIVSSIKKAKDKPDTQYQILNTSLLSGYTSILVTNFFGFSVVPVALFFFLYPAMSVVLAREKEQESRRVKGVTTLGYGQYLAIASIFLVTVYCLLTIFRFWYADTLFAKGEKFNEAGQYDQAFNNLQDAVRLNPGEPFYHDELSQSAASLAVAAQKQDQATSAAQLANLAISESDQVLKINPYHLNFWKNRTRVFYTLAEIDESYNQQALASLLQAAELAPTDAKIFYNLGLMYARLGQDEMAIETLEKTVQLKPNYEAARWALALFYEEKGEVGKAKNELEYILERINPENETVKEKLEELE